MSQLTPTPMNRWSPVRQIHLRMSCWLFLSATGSNQTFPGIAGDYDFQGHGQLQDVCGNIGKKIGASVDTSKRTKAQHNKPTTTHRLKTWTIHGQTKKEPKKKKKNMEPKESQGHRLNEPTDNPGARKVPRTFPSALHPFLGRGGSFWSFVLICLSRGSLLGCVTFLVNSFVNVQKMWFPV